MLRVFLSGGMSGLSHKEMTQWRNDLSKAFAYHMVKPISPTDYFVIKKFDDDNEREAFIFDIHQVRNSDVVVVNLDKLDSIGTAQEVMIAYEYKKPIIAIAHRDKWELAHSWYKQEVTKVFIYEDYDDTEDLYKDVADYVSIYE